MLCRRSAIAVLGLLTTIAACAPMISACGGGSSGSTPTPETLAATATSPAVANSTVQQPVRVSLTEWKIAGADGAVIGPLKAGDVTFDVKNEGTTPHEFVVIRSDADPASFPLATGGKFDEEAAGESPGETGDIDVGGEKTAAMHLDPGTYVFVCNLPGHYKSGMSGKFTVE